jgi:hypothetical protein
MCEQTNLVRCAKTLVRKETTKMNVKRLTPWVLIVTLGLAIVLSGCSPAPEPVGASPADTTPDKVVKSFYNWYLGYPGNPMVSEAYRSSEYLSEEFVQKVDEIIASNLAARGGKDRVKALQSLRAIGTATASGGRVARVTYEIKRPGLFRLEFSSQGTKSVFAYDGEIGWQVAPLQGQFEPQLTTPETDQGFGGDERDIEGPLVDWREKGHLVELVGREMLESGEAFKLEVKLKDGSVRHDYVAVESRQIVRSDLPRMVRGDDVVLVDIFSDFREVNGLVFPHLIESHVKDRPEVIRIEVEKIELDPNLDEARFQFPE